MVKYTIIIERGKRNYSAYCPDLPGVIATGRTHDEIMARMKEAIEFHVEGLQEQHVAIPAPSTHAEIIEISSQPQTCV
ncbi:MAG: type II toxin-antitoxin system HicB family antitoxin [Methanoregula sp.]|nr:type II toxin-antitoxin system HicB family antitoxin [Methanoregula sp.]